MSTHQKVAQQWSGSTGKEIRLNRILHPKSRRSFVLALDHGISVGPIPGMESISQTMEQMGDGTLDAVVLHQGMAHRVAPLFRKHARLGLIVHLSASTDLAPDANAKRLVCSVEHALRLGADAISVHVNLGSRTEGDMLADLGAVSMAAQQWGMPLLGMLYVRGENIRDSSDPKVVAHALRVAMELNVDLIKVSYTGDPESFARILEPVDIPVIAAGGARLESDEAVLRLVADMLRAGASGVSFGRNIFQSSRPRLLSKAISAMLHHGVSVEDALGLLVEPTTKRPATVHPPLGRAEPAVESSEQLLELANGFRKSRLLLTACGLDLFTCLDRGTLTAEEVAAVIGADPATTARLLHALCALTLLTKQDGKFLNTAIASRHLVRDKPDYLANLQHLDNVYTSWNHLTERVKEGSKFHVAHWDEWPAAKVAALVQAMHRNSQANAARLLSLVDLSGVDRVLDVGGGSGAYAMSLARAKPGLIATVYEQPNVVCFTQQYIQKENMADVVNTVAGDYRRDDLGQGYDLVLLSSVIHANSPEINQLLLRKIAGALNPGGRVVIREDVMNDDRISPAANVLWGINMLLMTVDGDTYTDGELRAWLQAAGFSDMTYLGDDRCPAIIVAAKRQCAPNSTDDSARV